MREKPASTSVGRAVAQFALSGLAAVALLGVLGVYLFSQVGRREATDDARNLTRLAGDGIVRPLLGARALAGDPASLAQLDAVVRRRVLVDPVVRVKVWATDGTILYSDERRLIGQRYPLKADEVAALKTGSVEAELSDLSRPENRFERQHKKLLEVYLPLRTPDGRLVLYEEYLRYSSIAANARRVWAEFAPALIGALLLLELVQVPLAWSLARRLRERQREREALLQQAVDASDIERRRIAADLHDGLVQDLAGLQFELTAAAERGGADVATLRRASEAARAGVRQLRSLLVQIYPPTLHSAGLDSALADLLASASARGLDTSLSCEPLSLAPETEELLFRAAQEGVRNVVAHAGATSVDVRVERRNGTVTLLVADDGRGFDAGEATARRGEGHLGLTLLASLADQAGGTLAYEPADGGGTRLRLEVPA